MITMTKLNAMKRIQEEYKSLSEKPIMNFGITVGLCNEDNIFEWRCTLIGPRDTCYGGGLFLLKINFPDDYPNTRPEIVFETPIYHLNVKFYVEGTEPLGHISYSNLNNWNKEYTMRKVLPEIFDLLYKNNPDSAYDYEDNRRKFEFLNNRKLFEEKAKYFTKQYANFLEKKKCLQQTGILAIINNFHY